MNWRITHLFVGVTGFVIFILQGSYMAGTLLVPELSDTLRMLYRSAHIYFMLACAVNIVMGCFMQAGEPTTWLQRLCSALIVVSPLLLLLSFFTEIDASGIDRVLLSLALYAIFAGVALLATRALLQALRNRTA